MELCVVREYTSRMGLTVHDQDKNCHMEGCAATKDGLQVVDRTAGALSCISSMYVASKCAVLRPYIACQCA